MTNILTYNHRLSLKMKNVALSTECKVKISGALPANQRDFPSGLDAKWSLPGKIIIVIMGKLNVGIRLI
jgi:hypothetical protein